MDATLNKSFQKVQTVIIVGLHVPEVKDDEIFVQAYTVLFGISNISKSSLS